MFCPIFGLFSLDTIDGCETGGGGGGSLGGSFGG